MNKNFLKIIRDQIPEPLKYLAAPLFRNKLIKDKEYKQYYKLLEEREALSSAKIKEYQFNQLKQILIYSFEHVPYYKELFNEISFDPNKFYDFAQIKSIPFLTREIIMANYDKLISIKKVKNGYYLASTGGSTGQPLKFLLDYDSIYKECAFIYYYRKKLGYNVKDKLATFRQIEFGDSLWKQNPMHNEIIFSPMRLSKRTIKDYAGKINEYRPHYLNGYLSAIYFFAKLLFEYKIEATFNLKGIFLISENPDRDQRKFVEDFFHVKSSTFYGHSERCVIAEEMIPNQYKFDPYYGYTELIQDEDKNYTIVGTGFLNYKMPFIRYKTDDLCYSHDQYCAIEGKRRSTIGLYGKNDEFIRSTAFLHGNPAFENIITYQFIQNEKGKADLLIVAGEHFNIKEIDYIRKEISNQTRGLIDIDIKIVQNLILSPRGKFQFIISNIEHNLIS